MNEKNIVIVGRPNVGKTSFFNKFVRKNSNRAIVFKEAGTTIDYKRYFSDIFDSNLIDTPGLSSNLPFSDLCNHQTKLAIEQSDLCLFFIDGGQGVTLEDIEYAKFVRKTKKSIHVLLIINKCDKKNFDENIDENKIKALGFGGDSLYVSSEQNIGFSDVAEKVLNFFSEKNISEEIKQTEENQNIIIDFSIVGRPNTGKSTLLNRLFGDQRAVVSDISGTTRDSISADIKIDDETIIRVSDTAGIRKNEGDYDNLEKMAVNSTLISIQFANIAALVIDGTIGFEKQDLIIGEHVLDEGRALIVLINKADQIRKKDEMIEALKKISNKYLAGAPIFLISAKTGFNCEILFSEIKKIYLKWIKRIKTSKLNNWLHDALLEHEHRLAGNKKAVKIKFISQYDIRPPHFYVNINKTKALDETYKRYLINSLRKSFDFYGVPIRVEFRSSENPYLNKKS